jgi:hypothetical protein
MDVNTRLMTYLLTALAVSPPQDVTTLVTRYLGLVSTGDRTARMQAVIVLAMTP